MSITGTKRKAKQLHVPSMEEDPAERKRILNVLAQRRYRRKKKEHVQNLERSVAEQDASSTSSTLSPASTSIPQPTVPITDESALDRLDSTFYINPTTDAGYFITSPDISNEHQDFIEPSCLDSNALAVFDATFPYPLPSLPSSPSMTNSTTTPSTLSDASPTQQSMFGNNVPFSRDEVHLPMLELNLLRGAMAIAKRLQVDSLIWSLDATSPFCNSAFTSSYSHLPINLQPTSAQLTTPHHPVFDILPWPSVRDKLITIFALPRDFRPPGARGPTAMLDLVYDMEDPAEGIRIWGEDPYSDKSWEVGEKLFSNWWWALNSEVVGRANEFRRNRGATMLGADRDIQEIE